MFLILFLVMGFLLLFVGVSLLPFGVDFGTFTSFAKVEFGAGPFALLLLVFVKSHHFRLFGFLRFLATTFRLHGLSIFACSSGRLVQDLVG